MGYSFKPPPSGQKPYSISASSDASASSPTPAVLFSAARSAASSASHSSTSVPASASELFCVHLGWCGSPVLKLTSMMGIPVRVLNAGDSFSARSSALASKSPRSVSPPSSRAAASPPSTRMVLSNTFAFLSASNASAGEAIQSRASPASSSSPRMRSVSSASTMVSPTSSHATPFFATGASSSEGQACSRYPRQACLADAVTALRRSRAGTAANAASSRASSAATSASDAGGSFSANPRPSRQSSRGTRAVAEEAASRSHARVGAGVPKGSSAPGTHAPPVALTPSTHRPTVDPAPRAADAAAKSSGLEHAPRRSTASTSASETRARVAVRMLATTPTRRGAAPCLRVCRARDRTLSGGEKRVFAATPR